MSLNIEVLAQSALNRALEAAKGHRDDLKTYLKRRSKIIAEGSARIVADRLAGKIDDADVKFAFEEIRATERTMRLALKVTSKVALQNAVNAALAVTAGAINQAVGAAIL